MHIFLVYWFLFFFYLSEKFNECNTVALNIFRLSNCWQSWVRDTQLPNPIFIHTYVRHIRVCVNGRSLDVIHTESNPHLSGSVCVRGHMWTKKKLSWQNWPCMKSLRACRLWHQNPNGWRNVCVKCRRHRSILTWAKANRTENRSYTNENRYESQMTYPPHACMLIASRESSGNRTHTQNTNVQRTQQHRLVKSSCSEQLK